MSPSGGYPIALCDAYKTALECDGCGCPKARCEAVKPPAVKCCPDCKHEPKREKYSLWSGDERLCEELHDLADILKGEGRASEAALVMRAIDEITSLDDGKFSAEQGEDL